LGRSFERAAARAQNLHRRASFDPAQNENGIAQPDGAPLDLTARKQFQQKNKRRVASSGEFPRRNREQQRKSPRGQRSL